MELSPITPHYDVYQMMHRLERLKREDLWRILKINPKQKRHAFSNQKHKRPTFQVQHQRHLQVVQPASISTTQCQTDSRRQFGISHSNQSTNDHLQAREHFSDLPRAQPSGNSLVAITQYPEIKRSGMQNHQPLMIADGESNGSQTMVIMYPTNIVSQRLLSGKPPLRPDRFPKVSDDVEQLKTRTCTESEQTKSLPNLRNNCPAKISNPLRQLYTFVKQLSVSSGEISTSSTGNKTRTAITCSDLIKFKQESPPSETKLIRPDIKSASNNRKRSTSVAIQPSSCVKSCATEGNAFQCCTCGRIIVLKRRPRNQDLIAKGTIESGSRISETKGKVSQRDKNCTQNQKGLTNHIKITKSFTMTAYDVFSFSCLLMAIPLLYTAYSSGLFDGVMDYKTEGPQREFYCVIGLLVVARLTWHYAWKIWNRYIASLDETFFEPEVWAVITGCTNGIGKEYARQLAAKQVNVILISRDANLLMELARDISNEFNVRTVTIQADFSTGDQSLYDMIETRLQGFDIVILVNNVGMSHDTLDRFHVNTPDSLVDRLIHVNMTSMAKMTKMLLPGMVCRRRGLIINVSSAFGRNPAPYLALYGATKSFADYFSRALQKEYGKHHIAVQSLTPYVVSTNMTKNAPPTLIVPSAETFVRSALNTAGLESRTHGYLPHSVLGTILDNAPSWVRHSYMKLFRYRASKLMERQKLQHSN